MIETPIYLTATMAVGRVFDGAVAAAVRGRPGVGVDDVVIPVVGECDDSWLNEARVVQVEAADAGRGARRRRAAATLAEGAVGAGTGHDRASATRAGSARRAASCPSATRRSACSCWPTSARARDLRIDGVPVGRLLGDAAPAGARDRPAAASRSSPPTRRSRAAQLERVARRAGLGLARTGSVAHHGSGEIFLAFSTARGAGARCADGELDPLFAATVDATEEAVLNALWAAPSASSAARAASPRRSRTTTSSRLLRAHRRL